MYIVQKPLFDFNEFFALDESNRLVLVLKTIDAEALIRALQGEDEVGRTGFHARVLWSALIVGVVYRIPTVAELRRNLASNPYLRFVCGMASAVLPKEGFPVNPPLAASSRGCLSTKTCLTSALMTWSSASPLSPRGSGRM